MPGKKVIDFNKIVKPVPMKSTEERKKKRKEARDALRQHYRSIMDKYK